ncbi:NACHT, LRR and PYD domains-containing protein 1-like isoform X2 [Artibeus jamaicensis]|uniref:NACHT, LRR and PYD domains-containing protein 1-like isoform X2 n=1 Tax=Artibeus jamaicensis TaxID=9417 RepID=UPI00235AF2EB|nr:NACHT, LRR and PYD domains-containing protein 1-like isoform X2 [Artibeus jamaicensis]
MDVSKAIRIWTKQSSGADMAPAADLVGGAKMSEGVPQRLAWYLESLTKEQLKEFQQQLHDQILYKHQLCRGKVVATTQPEKVDSIEMASRLVAQYGEQQAWDLVLQTWKQMGLSELCARALKEATFGIRFSWGPFKNTSWLIFFSCLKVTETLKKLDLRGNFLSGSAVQSLCEVLKCNNCHLETVCLADCGLTAEKCKDLAHGLSTTWSLTVLNLSLNNIEDTGAQHLFQQLGQTCYNLQQLVLVNCGLTSACCQDLASMFKGCPRLKILNMHENDLGDLGGRLLCEGLRQATCQLHLLCLDRNKFSEEVKKMLKNMNLEEPLKFEVSWRPSLTIPEETPSKGEMDNEMSPLKWQTPESEKCSAQAVRMVTFSLYSETPEDHPVKPLGTEDGSRGQTEHVASEVIDKYRSLYRVHFPMAGFYSWNNTGFSFVVRRPVTIEIQFCSWKEILDQIVPQHSWMVAGPLFNIKAEPGAVAAVYIPHFVDLQGKNVDKSCFRVAHIKWEGIFLEAPTRVESHYAVVENPSFFPMVLLRKVHAVLRIPIISSVLLYHHHQHEEVTFHLYLIPNDCSIRKAIDDEEKKFQFVQLHKPPPLTPLYMGSRYTVSGSEEMEIIPQELELCYRNPGEAQLFSELHVGHFRSSFRLYLREKEEGTLVWEALVKPGDLRPEATLVPPCDTEAPGLLHFMDQHRGQLVARVTSVDSVLDKLYGRVLNDEQYERVRAEPINPNKMRMLFSFSNSWDRACKDQLLQALKDTHPHLIKELQEKESRGSSPYCEP